MKRKDFKRSLMESTSEQLGQKVEELRRSLFMLRLSKKTSHASDISQFKKLRRDIACILTFMNH